jgi:hypothetical protein
MKTGVFERVLTRRYGKPITSIRDGMGAKVWNPGDDHYEARLYLDMKWHGIGGLRYASLRDIYGDSFGGVIIKNTLKAALLSPRSMFHVWNIEELRELPTVQYAVARDPRIDYFMDENNVLYYGVKNGVLYVFDTLTDELDPLGPVEQALETILDDWAEIFEEPPDDEPSP